KMLGRLARWLRLIGADTTYGSHLGSYALIRHARNEQRTILTRDHRVCKAAADLEVIFVDSDSVAEQLRQVISLLALDPWVALFTRCVSCNTPVVAVPKEDVAHRVPVYVYTIQTDFARCPHCLRIYWPGTHYDRVREHLHALGCSTPAAT